MFSGSYSAEDLEFVVPADETPGDYFDVDDSVYSVIETVDVSDGSNSDSISVGYTGEEVVLMKPGSVNFGRAGPAHVAAAMTADELDLYCPDIWYDPEEDTILMEYLGELESVAAGDSYGGLEEAIVPKVVAGDPDILTNIGYGGESWHPYDFDCAGSPLKDVRERLRTGITERGLEVDLEEVGEQVSKDISELDINSFIPELEEVLDEFFPERLGFNTLDLPTYRHNLEMLRDRPFESLGVER
jgi:hypothetical protein